jgi:hypothetical protein
MISLGRFLYGVPGSSGQFSERKSGLCPYLIRNMARGLAALLLVFFGTLALAEESYLGLFLQGQKIGYVHSTDGQEKVGGQILHKSDTKTVLRAALLGDALTINIASQTWSDASGNPRLMKFFVDSGGRSQRTEATFAKNAIHVVVDNNGAKSTKTIPMPTDAKVVDDAVLQLLADGAPAGTERAYYVLDPMTVSLIKNRARLVGPAKATVNGKEYDARLIEIVEPRATTKVYVSAKGDLIKAEAIAGIEMLPLSREEALSGLSGPAPRIDLAAETRIRASKPLSDLDGLASSILQFSDVDLSRAPSDGHQTVRNVASAWKVEVHPVVPNPKTAASIAAAAKSQPKYLEAGLNLPADSPTFRNLAEKVVGGASNVVEGAQRVHRHVYSLMKPNAGIGVLRDASEVLRSGEGVCRDYAILTATILRAASIPARLASGLVWHQDAFYYHAWTEYWDGKRWIGLDTTRQSGRVTAGHVKLAHGTVEEAFLFTFLDGAKVDVLDLKRRAAGGAD